MKSNQIKNTALFLSSQTLSLFGSALVQYAMSWYITLKTQSGAMMAIAIICGFLPTFFISPFAGVWADRYNRKMIIIAADAAIAISTLGAAIIFMFGYREIWLIFIVMAIRGTGQGIQQPAVNAFLTQIVPEEKLMKVNAANGTIQSVVTLVSPMLAGLLMSFASMEIIFLIDVITALAAISILVLLLRVGAHTRSEANQANSFLHDFRLGLEYISRHGFLKNLFIFCTVFYLMAGPVAFLSPLQVTRLFGADTWRLSAIEAVFAVGMMVGGVMMMSWGGFKNRHHSMTLGFFIFSSVTIVLGILPLFWAYLVLMLVIGLSMPIFNTPAMVMLQEKVEPSYLGRVFGFLSMLSSIGMPAGILVFGPLSDTVSLSLIFIITGAVMFISSFAMLINKPLNEAGKPLPPSI